MSVQELEIAIEKLSPAEVETLAMWLDAHRKRTLKAGSAFATLREAAGSVEMPADWAAQHDHYLTGAPKRDLENQSS